VTEGTAMAPWNGPNKTRNFAIVEGPRDAILCIRKLESSAVVLMALFEHRLVTDRWTNRHTMTTCTALA